MDVLGWGPCFALRRKALQPKQISHFQMKSVGGPVDLNGNHFPKELRSAIGGRSPFFGNATGVDRFELLLAPRRSFHWIGDRSAAFQKQWTRRQMLMATGSA